MLRSGGCERVHSGSLSRSHFVLSLMLIDDNLSDSVAGQWVLPLAHTAQGGPTGSGLLYQPCNKPKLSPCIVKSAGKKRMDI